MAWSLWKRLDVPGHDASRLVGNASGWTIDGTAVFLEDGAPSTLSYQLACDSEWRSERGRVAGWIGSRAIDYGVLRTSEGVWFLNGIAVPGLENCVDLDFSFTPASNLPQIRRIALRRGQSAIVPVAWLDVSEGGLTLLDQRYERVSEFEYLYESNAGRYLGILETDHQGFVRHYPGLWVAEF